MLFATKQILLDIDTSATRGNLYTCKCGDSGTLDSDIVSPKIINNSI